MAAQHTQIETNKQEFRWSFRKKGKDVLKLCRQLTLVMTVAGGLVVIATPAQANPSGGNVVGGSATISHSGTTTTINQSSNRAIIEWNNFDIAAGETTRFIQPSTSALALNRVVNSSQATAINGNLIANGRVLVINPNGVLIGPSGNVDVAGFVASTADISNTRFMTATGAMEFDRAGKIDATVENQGRITIRDAGLGLLVAPVVRNSGVIQGNMARLQLGAGDTFGVDLYGDGLLHLAVGNTGDARTIKAENAGTIVADAGKVVMTAAAANNVVNSVINTSGVIEAKGLVAKGGEIILTGEGANVQVAGKIDASGKTGGGSVKIGGDVQGADTLAKAKTVDVKQDAQINANAGTSGDGGTIAVWSDELTTSRGRFSATGGSESGNGGFVETSSKEILDISGTFVDTSAAFGAYGMWLLDPTFYSIDSSNIADINGATSNVTILSGGNIDVSENVNITNANISLILQAGANITINRDITLNGGDLLMTAGASIGGNNGAIKTNGGDISAISGATMGLHKDLLTSGGNVSLQSGSSFEYNNFKIHTGGGNVNLSSGASLTVGNANISTAGGDVALSSGAALTTDDTKINTTGGSTPATVKVVENGTTKSFSSVYNAPPNNNGTLQQTGNAGDVTISGKNLKGNQFCVSAGGNTCGVNTATVTPTVINVTIKANDVYKTYGSLDPALTYTVTYSQAHNATFSGSLVRQAGESVRAGGYAINQGTLNVVNAGGYTYVVTYQAGTFTINPAFLTITANNRIKTYGDVLNLGNTGFTTVGLKNSDAVNTATLTSNGRQAGANVGSYDINISNAVGSGLSNYNINYVKGTLVVDPATLTITTRDQAKVYGDTKDVDGAFLGYFVNGLKNNDRVTDVTLTSAGAAATANVGSYDIQGSNVTGSGLGNYTINFVNGKLTVTPAALLITSDSFSKTYGQTHTFDNTDYAVYGLKNSDTVTGVTMASAGAAATANVGFYGITAGNATGTGLGNYIIAYTPGIMRVNQAALTITANDQTKTYGSNHNLGNTAFNTNGLMAWDNVNTVNLSSAGAAGTASVGDYAINIGGANGSGLSNYNITYVKGNLLVDQAILTITAADQSKTYGDYLDVSAGGYTHSGLFNNDAISSVMLASAGGAETASAGDYAITASDAAGNGLGNYKINYVDGKLVVDKANLTVTANNRTKVYGDTLSLGNTGFTTAGLKNSDTVNTATLTSNGRQASASVNDYDINIGNAIGNGLDNYNISYVKGKLTVTPAALTITARDQFKVYGDSKNVDNAFLAYFVNGLKNNDRVTDVNLTSTGGAATANVGGYDIVAGGAVGNGLSNYTINYVNGTLHVTPALLTITSDSFSKTYGQAHTFSAADYGVYGLKNSDTVTGVTMASNGAAANANVGFYGITASNATGSGLSNYIIAYTPGIMRVNQAALTITANDQSKTYGSNHNLGNTAFTQNGLMAWDNINSVNLASQGAAGTANTGTYAITANGAAGSGLSNYKITYVDGALTVNQAALMVVANNQTKQFGSPFVFNGTEFTTVGPMFNGDTVSSVTLTSPGEAANASALNSPYKIYASNASGSGLSNYNIQYVDGLMTVTPAPSAPNIVIDPLGRPVMSVANKVIVRDLAFEGFETQTTNVDVALRYRGGAAAPSPANPVAALAALEPAAGGDLTAEDLANLEPAAGGDATPAPSGNSDVDCANSFLDNQPCGIVQ